jgi:hypothetical protein
MKVSHSLWLSGAVALLAGAPVRAHHSFAKFDRQQTVEVEGELIDVRWQNPHVHFTLRGRIGEGAVQDWDLEANSPGILRRMGVTADLVAVGDHVRVSGNPTVNGAPEINAQNMLLADGSELLLGQGQPVFSNTTLGDPAAWRRSEGDTSRPELGLFRVWSSTLASAFTLFPDLALFDYPLTDSARAFIAAFDREEQSRLMASSCTPKGMPWIMEQPYDLAFERAGEDIVLRLEEYDVARRIHMGFGGNRAAQPFTIHGFSTGEWDGDTLVVTTTNLSSKNYKWEIPATEAAQIVERFTPTARGDRLDYELLVTDPNVFTAPVRLTKYWISVPGQVLDAYNCGRAL